MAKTAPNPLATGYTVVLTDDPAIDKRAMGIRDFEAMDPAEREKIEPTEEQLAADPLAMDAVYDKLGAAAMQRYIDTRDIKHLVFKAGAKPSKFKVTALRSTFLAARIDGDGSLSSVEGAVLALRGGMHEGVHADGSTHRPDKVEVDSTKQFLADEEWPEKVRDVWGQNAVYQLGVAVQILSRLPVSARPTSPSSAG